MRGVTDKGNAGILVVMIKYGGVIIMINFLRLRTIHGCVFLAPLLLWPACSKSFDAAENHRLLSDEEVLVDAKSETSGEARSIDEPKAAEEQKQAIVANDKTEHGEKTAGNPAAGATPVGDAGGDNTTVQGEEIAIEPSPSSGPVSVEVQPDPGAGQGQALVVTPDGHMALTINCSKDLLGGEQLFFSCKALYTADGRRATGVTWTYQLHAPLLPTQFLKFERATYLVADVAFILEATNSEDLALLVGELTVIGKRQGITATAKLSE